MLEVEQKFAIADQVAIREKLQQMGMKPIKERQIIDWYFDLDPPVLSPRDLWLRYREVKGQQGRWELKKGRKHAGGVTVYEEVEGEKAFYETVSMIPNASGMLSNHPSVTEFEGHFVPKLPDPSCGLVPFCRLDTTRSTWAHGRDPSGIIVDLDISNYGYMVGEAELVVSRDDQIADAKRRIQLFLKELNVSFDTGLPTLGKLEYYLAKYRPEHFKMCNPAVDLTKLNLKAR
jgi:thiamine-triphosphatase